MDKRPVTAAAPAQLPSAARISTASSRIIDLNSVRDWHDVLSAEEQQLIGVARLLLAAPRLAVLRPLAANLGIDQAKHVLAAVAERGVGDVVLRDGKLGSALFDAVVEIGADGTWTHPPTKEETR